MANCFENIIGIKGVCGELETPSSGLWIDDLPFIDLKVADAVLGKQDASGVEFIQTKLNYAYNVVKNEAASILAPMMKTKTILENSILGAYTPTLLPLNQAAKYRGIKVRISDYPYLSFNLSGIAMYSSNFTGQLPIKVFDLTTGAQIDTFNIAVTAGQINYIPINKKYLTNRQRFEIAIVYDATLIDTFKTSPSIPAAGCFSCNRGNDGYNGRYMIYDGIESNVSGTLMYSQLEYTGFTGGLSVQYTVECSMDGWLCSMKDRLAFAMLHKFGIIMCEEVIAGSKRMNSITTIDVSKAEYLHGIFTERYHTALKDALGRVTPPNDNCFYCNKSVRTITRIP
jgi:hypothetical protein